jgi:hypothetical protein
MKEKVGPKRKECRKSFLIVEEILKLGDMDKNCCGVGAYLGVIKY